MYRFLLDLCDLIVREREIGGASDVVITFRIGWSQNSSNKLFPDFMHQIDLGHRKDSVTCRLPFHFREIMRSSIIWTTRWNRKSLNYISVIKCKTTSPPRSMQSRTEPPDWSDSFMKLTSLRAPCESDGKVTSALAGYIEARTIQDPSISEVSLSGEISRKFSLPLFRRPTRPSVPDSSACSSLSDMTKCWRWLTSKTESISVARCRDCATLSQSFTIPVSRVSSFQTIVDGFRIKGRGERAGVDVIDQVSTLTHCLCHDKPGRQIGLGNDTASLSSVRQRPRQNLPFPEIFVLPKRTDNRKRIWHESADLIRLEKSQIWAGSAWIDFIAPASLEKAGRTVVRFLLQSNWSWQGWHEDQIPLATKKCKGWKIGNLFSNFQRLFHQFGPHMVLDPKQQFKLYLLKIQRTQSLDWIWNKNDLWEGNMNERKNRRCESAAIRRRSISESPNTKR